MSSPVADIRREIIREHSLGVSIVEKAAMTLNYEAKQW